MQRYSQLADIVKFVRPRSIIETGTHSGKRAEKLCREALKYSDRIHYTGYDLFDLATPKTDGQEMNGKGAGSIAEARRRLDRVKREHPGFTYDLVRGNTRKTLHGTEHGADLVYIDGGHSVETIRGDYEAVKWSRVIVFDDWYEGVDTGKFGCNEVLKDVQHIVLPRGDGKNGRTIKLAVVGYDPKWVLAMESCRTFHGIKTIAQWRGKPVAMSDMIACINYWEQHPDAGQAIEEAKKWAVKRIFFVIKEDALRSIEQWRDILNKHLRVEQWFGHGGEVCGTGVPLVGPEKIKSYGAWDNDKRYDNIKANVALISRRIRLEHGVIHDKRAILICYGPSLQQEWPHILPEAHRTGGDIISVSGAHDFLVERGVIPKYHVDCDPRPHKAKNLDAAHPGINYYMASCCHPDLIAKLKDANTSLWHLCNGEDSIKQIAELEGNDSQLVMGGGNAGLRAIALFYALGYRTFSIYGMDCSFADKGETQHAGKHFGSKQKLIDVKTGERWFTSSAVLMSYVEHFKSTMQHAPDAVFELHGDGLLQYHCQLMVEEKEKAA